MGNEDIQLQFITVFKTAKPLGSYWICSVDVNFFDNDDFWDFSQVGMDQEAIIITANIF